MSKVISFLAGLFIGLLICWIIYPPIEKYDFEPNYSYEQERQKLSIIIDSLRNVKQKIKIVYREKIISIDSLPDSLQYKFFTERINSYQPDTNCQ